MYFIKKKKKKRNVMELFSAIHMFPKLSKDSSFLVHRIGER